jgi:hypothetical protein
MSLPISALKDDELLHYAGLDPAASEELARRMSREGFDPSAERNELRDEVDQLERQLSDIGDERNNLAAEVSEACALLWRAVEHDEDEKLTVSELIKLALNCLE